MSKDGCRKIASMHVTLNAAINASQSILDIKTHFKPTETFQYTSSHPPGVKKRMREGPSTETSIIFRFREMDAFAGSDNEAPLLMAVSMGFSSISSPLDEASAILIWAERYSI